MAREQVFDSKMFKDKIDFFLKEFYKGNKDDLCHDFLEFKKLDFLKVKKILNIKENHGGTEPKRLLNNILKYKNEDFYKNLDLIYDYKTNEKSIKGINSTLYRWLSKQRSLPNFFKEAYETLYFYHKYQNSDKFLEKEYFNNKTDIEDFKKRVIAFKKSVEENEEDNIFKDFKYLYIFSNTIKEKYEKGKSKTKFGIYDIKTISDNELIFRSRNLKERYEVSYAIKDRQIILTAEADSRYILMYIFYDNPNFTVTKKIEDDYIVGISVSLSTYNKKEPDVVTKKIILSKHLFSTNNSATLLNEEHLQTFINGYNLLKIDSFDHTILKSLNENSKTKDMKLSEYKIRRIEDNFIERTNEVISSIHKNAQLMIDYLANKNTFYLEPILKHLENNLSLLSKIKYSNPSFTIEMSVKNTFLAIINSKQFQNKIEKNEINKIRFLMNMERKVSTAYFKSQSEIIDFFTPLEKLIEKNLFELIIVHSEHHNEKINEIFNTLSEVRKCTNLITVTDLNKAGFGEKEYFFTINELLVSKDSTNSFFECTIYNNKEKVEHANNIFHTILKKTDRVEYRYKIIYLIKRELKKYKLNYSINSLGYLFYKQYPDERDIAVIEILKYDKNIQKILNNLLVNKEVSNKKQILNSLNEYYKLIDIREKVFDIFSDRYTEDNSSKSISVKNRINGFIEYYELKFKDYEFLDFYATINETCKILDDLLNIHDVELPFSKKCINKHLLEYSEYIEKIVNEIEEIKDNLIKQGLSNILSNKNIKINFEIKFALEDFMIGENIDKENLKKLLGLQAKNCME